MSITVPASANRTRSSGQRVMRGLPAQHRVELVELPQPRRPGARAELEQRLSSADLVDSRRAELRAVDHPAWCSTPRCFDTFCCDAPTASCSSPTLAAVQAVEQLMRIGSPKTAKALGDQVDERVRERQARRDVGKPWLDSADCVVCVGRRRLEPAPLALLPCMCGGRERPSATTARSARSAPGSAARSRPRSRLPGPDSADRDEAEYRRRMPPAKAAISDAIALERACGGARAPRRELRPRRC